MTDTVCINADVRSIHTVSFLSLHYIYRPSDGNSNSDEVGNGVRRMFHKKPTGSYHTTWPKRLPTLLNAPIQAAGVCPPVSELLTQPDNDSNNETRRGKSRPLVLILTRSLIISSKEVKLSSNAAERDLYDSLAEIYSIIITLDGLEKAYIKDSIPEAQYTEICNRLLKQYRSTLKDDNVMREFVDLDTFKAEWDVRYLICNM